MQDGIKSSMGTDQDSGIDLSGSDPKEPKICSYDFVPFVNISKKSSKNSTWVSVNLEEIDKKDPNSYY